MNIIFSKTHNWFLILLTMHAAFLVASDAAGKKMVALPFGLSASATVFSYMVTFIIIDIVTEVFGKEASRKIINLSFFALLLSVGFFQLAIFAPAAPYWDMQSAYEDILGGVWRIALGGWGAYLISQNLDIFIYNKLQQIRFAKNLIFARSFVSTSVAQLIDTIFFITVAFFGVFPLLPAILGQYMIKVCMMLFGGFIVSFCSSFIKNKLIIN